MITTDQFYIFKILEMFMILIHLFYLPIVNNKRELEKWPEIEMDMPLKEVVELPPKGNVYADLDEARITSVEDVVRIVKEKIRSWGIDIVKCFNDYDK